MADEKTCIACGDARIMRESALLAGSRWPICERCAGVGATLAQEVALEGVRHCLHLFAMDCEAVAEGWQDEVGPMRRWLARLRSRLAEGVPRRLCPCDGCSWRPVAGAIPDLHEHFGVQSDPTAEGADWRVLLSMRESERLPSRDGGVVRAGDEIERRKALYLQETRYLGVKEGGLAARASAIMPRSRLHEHAEDRIARRYWSAVARFGPGYVDGPWFVDADGVCHEWPE